MGIPAASLMPSTISQEMDELRIAFDGDAVLFSDEAEVIAKKDGKIQAIFIFHTSKITLGLHAFFQNETEKEQIPLEKGPLIQFAFILGKMQKKFREAGVYCPIRTYLVTARR